MGGVATKGIPVCSDSICSRALALPMNGRWTCKRSGSRVEINLSDAEFGGRYSMVSPSEAR